jgi:ATP/maltotriose-dependent transcriptional regulator MalT
LETARESYQIPYVLDALTAAATLLVQTNDWQRAAEILRLVLDHHAATHGTKDRAARLLSQLETQREVLPAAVDDARSSHLEQVVQALLDGEFAENSDVNIVSDAVDSPLTKRELDILRLMADGLTNREIAKQLFLAVGTVKWYLSEIYGKLYVTSRTQAIVRAQELNLLN